MTSYGPSQTWVLADDDLAKWPEQFAALPTGTTVIVPSGDDRYYAGDLTATGEDRTPRLMFLTWAEARCAPDWDRRLGDRIFDYTKSQGGRSYRERWPGRYPELGAP
jgi:hypothetical protein